MGRSRLHTGTSYFIVTSNGKLRRLRPGLIVMAALLLSAALSVFAGQCFLYDQRLVEERQRTAAQLAQLNGAQRQRVEELKVCEESKERISKLLHFKTETGKTADE